MFHLVTTPSRRQEQSKADTLERRRMAAAEALAAAQTRSEQRASVESKVDEAAQARRAASEAAATRQAATRVQVWPANPLPTLL